MFTLRNTIIATASLSLMAFTSISLAAEGWVTSIEEGKTLAADSKKDIFVSFTGSDWCPPCQFIDKEVFSKKDFVKKVGNDFVLVVIDSPKKDEELAKKNQPLLKKFQISGFPTVLLLNADGSEYSRFTPTTYATVEKMLNHLQSQLKRKDMF